MLEQLFTEIDNLHFFTKAIDPAAIDNFDKQMGYHLPDDLKEFYRRYNTVRLFPSEIGALYRFVPIQEIHPTRYDIYGPQTKIYSSLNNWVTICDVLDGNYLALDVYSENNGEWNFIECFHETFAIPGESPIVARTFTELLAQALHNGDNQHFNIQEGFKGYGDGRPLTAENASLRIENPEAHRKGWVVCFALNKLNAFREFFADNDYGGKEKSFQAVTEFIEKCKREIEEN